MLLPFRHNPADAHELDPRHLESRIAERNQRLAIGISVASSDGAYAPSCGVSICDCQRCQPRELRGVLLVTRGHGKHLRIQHSICERLALPETFPTTMARSMNRPLQLSLDELTQLSQELTDSVDQLTAMLQRSAGKYVDRISCASIDVSSIWSRDFDGRPLYRSIVDPTQLSHSTGLTIVDDFPSRDILANGLGRPLHALPLWLGFGDRRLPVATEARMVIQLGRDCRVSFLPPSDGLDECLPELQFFQIPNPLSWLAMLAPDLTHREWLQAFSAGSIDSQVVSHVGEVLQAAKHGNTEGRFSGADGVSIENDDAILSNATQCDHAARTAATTCQRWLWAREVVSRLDVAKNPSHDAWELCRSLARALVRCIADSNSFAKSRESELRFLVDGEEPLTTIFISEWNHYVGNSNIQRIDEFSVPSGYLDASCVATMGLLHLDQFPVNHPHITGADQQRLLGRLTAGRPENWRLVVRSMADYHPPAMRLRDAI